MKKNFLRELLKKETLTDKLFRVIDDYEIYCSLIGHDIELGEAISSPIRGSDEFPSFALYIPTRIENARPEEIWFKDLAMGSFGNVFRFVQYYALHHFGEDLLNRYEVIKFIDRQLELGLFNGQIGTRVAIQRDYEQRELREIFYKSRNPTAKDLEYWSQLDQDKDDLIFWDVKSLRYLIDEHGLIRKEFRSNDLVFFYEIWDKGKLYQPENTRSFKFRNTCPGSDFRYYQGFKQLRGRSQGVTTLIITKSQKDVMVFYKMFNKFLDTPVDVIAPHAESINLSNEFIDFVHDDYNRVICVSDFDLAGVKFANQCKRHGFEYKFIDTSRIVVNGKCKVMDKDISDFRINNGFEPTKKLLSSWKLNAISKTQSLECDSKDY